MKTRVVELALLHAAVLVVDLSANSASQPTADKDHTADLNQLASEPATYAEQTPDGMNVWKVWKATMPKTGVEAAGLPRLESAEHVVVFQPTREQGAYNHHPALTWSDGNFYAMWSNHPIHEDGPGQRVLFAFATSPNQWSQPTELFPAPELPKDLPKANTPFAFITPEKWIRLNNRLYAIAGVNTAGWIAREVSGNGELGPIFRLTKNEAALNFDTLPASDPSISVVAADLDAKIGTPSFFPSSDFWHRYPRPTTLNGRHLTEPTVHRARDGNWIMLLRDSNPGGYSHRMFISVSTDGGITWPDAVPTDIPDSPSRRDTVLLSDGTLLLVGNQSTPEFDNPTLRRHLNRDPMTVAVSKDGYVYDRVFALRWNLPRDFRIRGVGGRSSGAQYPSAIVHDQKLYVLYSVRKEDIEFAWVPLSALGINIP